MNCTALVGREDMNPCGAPVFWPGSHLCLECFQQRCRDVAMRIEATWYEEESPEKDARLEVFQEEAFAVLGLDLRTLPIVEGDIDDE